MNMNTGVPKRWKKKPSERGPITIGNFTLVYDNKLRLWIRPGSTRTQLKSCATERDAKKWAAHYAGICGSLIEHEH